MFGSLLCLYMKRKEIIVKRITFLGLLSLVVILCAAFVFVYYSDRSITEELDPTHADVERELETQNNHQPISTSEKTPAHDTSRDEHSHTELPKISRAELPEGVDFKVVPPDDPFLQSVKHLADENNVIVLGFDKEAKIPVDLLPQAIEDRKTISQYWKDYQAYTQKYNKFIEEAKQLDKEYKSLDIPFENALTMTDAEKNAHAKNLESFLKKQESLQKRRNDFNKNSKVPVYPRDAIKRYEELRASLTN